MSSYARNLASAINTKVTDQKSAIPGREAEMATNNAGGVVFKLSPLAALDRFLILGTESSTFYQSARSLTVANATQIQQLLKTDGIAVVNRTIEVSEKGLASKNDPALLVMAMASNADDINVRRLAMDNLHRVARTGTHLFTYAEFVNGIRGWGRALKRAVANWYSEKDTDKLAYQMVKYQQRNGWSNRDLLRLSHPKTPDATRNGLYSWAVGKDVDVNQLPEIVRAFEAAKTATSVKEIVGLINQYNLPREAIPTSYLNSAEVWEALLQKMPLTAMIRNLGKMTSIGLISPLSDASKIVTDRLADQEYLTRSRIHPLAVINALYTYRAGRGNLGSLSWSPNQNVISALDGAFYKTFGNVTPSGGNTLIALDVSGSMTWGDIGGISGFNPRVASAAMALVTANVESNYHIVGFSHQLVDVNINPSMSLSEVERVINSVRMGSTDCSLPMTFAKSKNLSVDNFAVYTDNETYYGSIHPSQALVDYRKHSGKNARLAVVGMTATNFTIADPKDPGMMDFVGFSTDAPSVMSSFFRGEI